MNTSTRFLLRWAAGSAAVLVLAGCADEAPPTATDREELASAAPAQWTATESVQDALALSGTPRINEFEVEPGDPELRPAFESQDVIRDFGQPLSEPLPEALAARQLAETPASYQNHPEIGLRSPYDPDGAVELLHLRGERTRTLFRPDGSLSRFTALQPIHDNVDGMWVNNTPSFGVRGDILELRGSRLSAEIPVDMSTGWTVTSHDGTPIPAGPLHDLSIDLVTSSGSVSLPLPSGVASANGTTARIGEGRTTVVALLEAGRDGMGYSFGVDEDLAKSLPSDSEAIVISQFVPVPEGWEVLTAEGEPQMGQSIETCAPIFVARDLEAMEALRIDPPSIWDATFQPQSRDVIPPALGCPDAVRHVVRRVEGGILLALVADAEWLRAPDRAYPVIIDPYWTYFEQARESGPDTSGWPWWLASTEWTVFGTLNSEDADNQPDTDESVLGFGSWDWAGRYGYLNRHRARMHWGLEGWASYRATPAGGQIVNYAAVNTTTTYVVGAYQYLGDRPEYTCSSGSSWTRRECNQCNGCFWSLGIPSCTLCGCQNDVYTYYCPTCPGGTYPTTDNNRAAHIRSLITWADVRPTWNACPIVDPACWFSSIPFPFWDQWNAQTTAGGRRAEFGTRYTAPEPFTGWSGASTICSSCTSIYTEAARCGGEAGDDMDSACRVFRPANGNIVQITGDISQNDVDHYGFYFTSPRSPQLNIAVSDGAGGCSFDSVVEIWRVNPTTGQPEVLMEADDNFNPATGTESPCPLLQTYGSLPPGSYSVAVRGYGPGDTGSYRLTVQVTDNPDGFDGINAWTITGLSTALNPSVDYFGPDGNSDRWWAEIWRQDHNGQETNNNYCPAHYEGNIKGARLDTGGYYYVCFPDTFPWIGLCYVPGFYPYIEVRYVGEITAGPTSLTAIPMTSAECANVSQSDGCGITWDWAATGKANWYALLNGIGTIPQIFALTHDEVGLGENTRHTRRVAGVNEYGQGPSSSPTTTTTMVRTPRLADVSAILSPTVSGAIRTTVNSPPNMPATTMPACGGSNNCTAVRVQARQCAAEATPCSTDAQCTAGIGGQAATCVDNFCVVDTGWTRTTMFDHGMEGAYCMQSRARYRNQDGVASEFWSEWRTVYNADVLAPSLDAPTCDDVGVGTITWNIIDNSTNEDGFFIYTSLAAGALPAGFVAATDSGGTGATVPLTQAIAGAAGNMPGSVWARAWGNFPGFGQVTSDVSNNASAYTAIQNPLPIDFQIIAVTPTQVQARVLQPYNNACAGLTGARVERCEFGGVNCTTVMDFTATDLSSCANRGYDTFIDAGLTPSTPYEYRFWYINGSGCDSQTYAEVPISTLPTGSCCLDPSDPSDLDASTCTGVCATGTILCSGITVDTCVCSVTEYGATETCDGLDNDCDGVADDFTQPAVVTAGLCSTNTQTCLGGTWTDTPGNYTPQAEVCDGLDNDCDGRTDEDGSNLPLAEDCYTGPPGTRDEGLCTGGTTTCTAGTWSDCVGEVVPQVELCNLEDDDCDGSVDEEIAGRFCLGGRDGCSGPAAGTGVAGECEDGCRIGVEECVSGTSFCDISDVVLDVSVTIDDVDLGADVSLAECPGGGAGLTVCDSTVGVRLTITNDTPGPVPSTSVLELWLDFGEATELLLVGPDELGTPIPGNDTREMYLCFQNAVGVAEVDDRSLDAVVYDPDDSLTCVDGAQVGTVRPVTLGAPGLELCDGYDNDCDGISDRDEVREPCANSVGDGNLTCREGTDGTWLCSGD